MAAIDLWTDFGIGYYREGFCELNTKGFFNLRYFEITDPRKHNLDLNSEPI